MYSRLYYERKEGNMEYRLREIREAAHMTQQELADKSGVSRATIANIEIGKQVNIMTGTLLNLADALGVEAKDILFKE